MEVTDLKEGPVEPKIFDLPANFKKIERQSASD